MRQSLYIVCTVVLIAVVSVWILRSFQRNAEIFCGHNLRAIGIAIANYHDTHQKFPSSDAGGHSWRIRIVPYLFASHMYSHYHFDEPWNSDLNITLDTRPLPVKDGGPPRPHGMPNWFQCDPTRESRSEASYRMLVGDNAFGLPGRFRRSEDISDPLETTLIAAECVGSIHWLEPKDLNIDSMSFVINDPRRDSISSRHARGPAVLFADGEVYRLSPRVPAQTVRAMVTINGGERVERTELLEKGLLREY